MRADCQTVRSLAWIAAEGITETPCIRDRPIGTCIRPTRFGTPDGVAAAVAYLAAPEAGSATGTSILVDSGANA